MKPSFNNPITRSRGINYFVKECTDTKTITLSPDCQQLVANFSELQQC